MSKWRYWFVLFFSLQTLLLFAQEDKDLPKRPVPPKLVNDLAEVLSPQDIQALENKLVDYNDSTSSQITVVTVHSVKPFVIEDYAYKLGRYWGVGMAENDNGVVLLIAVDDHDLYIATGYGVEGYLPDIATKRIIDNAILPAFRNDQYAEGINAGVDAIFEHLAGAYQDEPYGASPETPNWIFVLIIVLVILFLMSRNKRNGGTTFSSGGPRHWGGGYGGFGGFGGGGFGGGGGGGGFGGFGGGSFGGGGAGGSW